MPDDAPFLTCTEMRTGYPSKDKNQEANQEKAEEYGIMARITSVHATFRRLAGMNGSTGAFVFPGGRDPLPSGADCGFIRGIMYAVFGWAGELIHGGGDIVDMFWGRDVGGDRGFVLLLGAVKALSRDSRSSAVMPPGTVGLFSAVRFFGAKIVVGLVVEYT